MPSLPPEAYLPLISALAGVIVFLYKRSEGLQKQISIVQEQKLQMVLQEAKDNMDMAKAVLKEENVREKLLEKIERIESLMEKVANRI